MPLSADDQQRLDEIERSLMAEDPVFSTTMIIDRLRRRRLGAAVGYFSVGVILLIAGLVSTQMSVTAGVMIGIVGFSVMVGAAALFFHHRLSH